jgi:hypothetical protein
MSNNLSLSLEEIPMYNEEKTAVASTPLEPFAGVDSILGSRLHFSLVKLCFLFNEFICLLLFYIFLFPSLIYTC